MSCQPRGARLGAFPQIVNLYNPPRAVLSPPQHHLIQRDKDAISPLTIPNRAHRLRALCSVPTNVCYYEKQSRHAMFFIFFSPCRLKHLTASICIQIVHRLNQMGTRWSTNLRTQWGTIPGPELSHRFSISLEWSGIDLLVDWDGAIHVHVIYYCTYYVPNSDIFVKSCIVRITDI